MTDEKMSVEEQEVLEADAEESAPTTDFIEYVGETGEGQYGTAFLTSHTLPKGDGLWKRNKVTAKKDLTWERDPAVPVGQKASMRLAVEDIDPDLVAVLEKTPGYKRVSE